MMDDESGRNDAPLREQPKLNTKEDAVLFLTIIGGFILFMILDLQLSKVILTAVHVPVTYLTNLIVLLFIFVETYVVYRIVKNLLIARKSNQNLPLSSKKFGSNRDSKTRIHNEL